MKEQESIVVCGSGIVGLAAALGLTRAGFRVTIVGPRPSPQAPPEDFCHPRVYAISPSSRQFLESLGMWALMDARRLTPVQAMEVFGDSGGHVSLHAWQTMEPALAWIVESGELERALAQSIQVYGIDWCEAHFTSLDGAHIVTDAGQQIAFDLLVGADGAQSQVRAAAKIAHHKKPYGDHGVVTHLTTELPHQNIAFQWFTGDSVLALLPLADTSQGNQVSMVWSMASDDASRLMALSSNERDDRLREGLHAVDGDSVGDLHVRSEVFASPLTLERSRMIGDKAVLVGDAAHRVHPLAGQGLNLGLGDVRDLITTLNTKESWYKIGDYRVLARYRRARAEPVQAMRVATDGLYQLFAQRTAPLVWARNMGMHWVNRLSLAKRLLINGAQ